MRKIERQKQRIIDCKPNSTLPIKLAAKQAATLDSRIHRESKAPLPSQPKITFSEVYRSNFHTEITRNFLAEIWIR